MKEIYRRITNSQKKSKLKRTPTKEQGKDNQNNNMRKNKLKERRSYVKRIPDLIK